MSESTNIGSIVFALRARVDELSALARSQEQRIPDPSVLEQARDQLAQLRADADDLKARLDQHLDDGECPKLTATDWTLLEGEERDRRIAQLRAWVSGKLIPLYGAYAEGVLRPCWANHQTVLMELEQLRQYWAWAFERRTPLAGAAMDFSDRWLPGALRRIDEKAVMHPSRHGGCPLENGNGR
ncbi:MAG TPA: hypothetical protein VMK13_12630 [Streptosporangiaceae bacterium]|nr:hypothetical protein [Streptosporangiaceae bacterium]